MSTDLTSTRLYTKALGCLAGGLIGDAVGTPTEGMHYRDIEARFGWLDRFESDGTDDTVMKNLLAEALIRSEGFATMDDWAQVWLDHWDAIFGDKLAKFFVSVIHTAQKLKRHATPRMAALGNMPSSSSAMCISPVGIVNPGMPREAAEQAYGLAALIHGHDVGYCQDGAAAMAAATSAAMAANATIEGVLEAATAYLLPLSGTEMLERIARAMRLARECGAYKPFCEAVYADPEIFFCRITCDSRETVPLTLALLYLADGDLEKSITYGANLGRDADTIASMAGAVAGALGGIDAVRADWRAELERLSGPAQADLARRLSEVAVRKATRQREALAAVDALL